MAERKPLSKSLRFEVFKRDSFTCQYCGAKAPDVILEVDHIKPVAEGGTNEILNLRTCCRDCNRGKGKRTLNNNSVIEKQRQQIEELNIRRQQLEMLLEWRDGLNSLDSDISNAAIDYYNKKWSETVLSGQGEAINADRAGRHCSIKLLPDNIHKQQFEDAAKDTFEDEIADAIIRLLSLCGYLSIDIDKHITEKMRYNANREKLHGKQY